MPCPAAGNAASVAGWLLTALGLGLSLPAEDNSDPGFSLCSNSFYRQTPPQGASAGALLRPLCHSLPRGQAFATLYNPTCDTAVYSAFHLRHSWTETGGGTESEENDIQVLVPALLRGGWSASELTHPGDSPLQHWDSSVTALVLSNIIPQCNSLGGDLYVLTGAGGLGSVGDEECKAKLWWSAVCCPVSEGEGGFSVGLVRETDAGDRVVSVNELEEMLGVSELFSDGCGGTYEGGIVSLLSEAFSGNIKKLDSDTTGQDLGENDRVQMTGEQVAGVDAQPEKAQVADITETSAEEVTSESTGEEQDDVTHSDAVRSESPQSSDDYEIAAALESDTNSSSTLVYIICSTFSILTVPLQPVVSTITQLPGQVTYVLQEDLGVLFALPGETFSLFHLMASDLVSGVGSTVDMLQGLGESCFSGLYGFTSSMLGALLTSCQTGVTGVGTLASDTVGIFAEAADNAWWVTRFFGERLWEQSEGYVGTVVSEMGGQAKAVGGGLGYLAWRGGNIMKD
ncbi:uncharacterized protein ACN63O_002270 [Diretmus argenteus]